MPYHPWVQFRRQRVSLGLPVNQPLLQQIYAQRPLIHSRWADHATFSPGGVAALRHQPAWVQNLGGVLVIQTAGVPVELLTAVCRFGAILESLITHQPRIFRGSAGGAVVYDRLRDRLYYAVSRWQPGLAIHATLAARVNQLTVVQTPAGPVYTNHSNRHAQTCAEFQALNDALYDGASEADLELWCFHVRDADPFPRCPNCEVTVPANALARVWTC